MTLKRFKQILDGLVSIESQQPRSASKRLGNHISVIDASSFKVVATVKAGDGPWSVAVATGAARN